MESNQRKREFLNPGVVVVFFAEKNVMFKYCFNITEKLLIGLDKINHNCDKNPKLYMFHRLIDRSSPKVVLVLYDFGSGGNFLLNCLSLSDDINTNLYCDKKSKIDYIKQNLENSSCIGWNDFLICPNEAEPNDDLNNKYYFFSTHTEFLPLEEHLNFWVGCNKIILFKNTTLFSNLRKCILKNKIDDGISNYKNNDFPIELDISKYLNLSLKNQEKLKIKYDDPVQKYSSCNLETKKELYIWDANWYLSENQTLDNIKKLYEAFELDGFDDESIRWYYNLWMNAIKEQYKKIFDV